MAMDGALLAALAEPNRLRIVELLNIAPRAVGEIASKLDLRQPQVTKHLQALERAGLVAVRRRGQMRDDLHPLVPHVDAAGEVEEVEPEIGVVAEELRDLWVPPGRHRDHGVAELVLHVLHVVAELGAQPLGDLRRLQRVPTLHVRGSRRGR